MTINDLEETLALARSNLWLYENEGLLPPGRKKPYKDYRPEDVSRLKKVIVLRKIGVPLSDIVSVFEGSDTMQNVIEKQRASLSERAELSGALEVCTMLDGEVLDIPEFDESYYFSLICAKEKEGQAFVDIQKDYRNSDLDILRDAWKRTFRSDFSELKNYGD